MFSLLKNKKIRTWCFLDFGISSFPTLILTFFYGAFYARHIVGEETLGTSLWGFSISLASLLSSVIFLVILIKGSLLKKGLDTKFFSFFFFVLIISTSSLFFFDNNANKFYPLISIIIAYISFELVNLFYNTSLHKLSTSKDFGLISNFGWAFGYLGGLLALFFVLIPMRLFEDSNKLTIFTFLMVGPFVGLWALIFGYPHFRSFKKVNFDIPKARDLLKNFKFSNQSWFIVSYFFFNNGVICIFSFASMFASFLFGLKESQILFMGIFINLSGIVGCLLFGLIDKKWGSEKCVFTSVFALTLLTSWLFFVESVKIFWITAIFIGFFIGPTQASSRGLISKQIKSKNQLLAFSTYSLLGNICAILGPFSVGYFINITNSVRYGLLIIPLFFVISFIPYIIKRLKN